MVKNKKNNKDDESLLDAFSSIVNELIDRNYKNSQDKMVKQMAPLMGSAIREQIKNQKDEVVDALYPVLGNMISRYVTKTFEEMLEKINNQIQNGLSFKAIKRKIQAKVQGISETELMLRENTTSNIRALLLIHKQTGVVLTIAENPNKPIHEPEMLASMVTAIQSFVNDWIEQNSQHQELAEIEFGESRIVIENSGYAFLAVIVDGVLHQSTYDNISKVLASIVLENGEDIRNFNGDLSTFSNIFIYKQISSLLGDNELKSDKKRIHPMMYIVPILIIMLILSLLYRSSVEDSILKRVQQTLYKTPQLTSYRISSNFEGDDLVIKGEVPSLYHKKLAYEKIKGHDGIKNIKNNLIVVDFEDTPMQIDSNIFYLIKGFNLSHDTLLNYNYNYPSLSVKGVVHKRELKQILMGELKKIKGIKTIEDKIKVIPPKVIKPKVVALPKIDTRVYFKSGSSKIEADQKRKLDSLVVLLRTLDHNLTISVSGSCDSIGSKELNEKIASKRAKAVCFYLKDIAKISQTVIEGNISIVSRDNKLLRDSQKARCAIVSLKK
jgi:hypothetical protein